MKYFGYEKSETTAIQAINTLCIGICPSVNGLNIQALAIKLFI